MKKIFVLLFILLLTVPLFSQDLVLPYLIVLDWIKADSLNVRAAKITSTLELDGSVSGGATFDTLRIVDSTGADSVTIYHNGTNLVIDADAGTPNTTFTADIQVTDQVDITDGTDTYTAKVASDKLTFQNDAGTPVDIMDMDSSLTVQINPTVADQEDPTFSIKGDADSDAAATTSETMSISLTPAATPTNSVWDWTSTQGKGYRLDRGLGIGSGAAMTSTVGIDLSYGGSGGLIIGADNNSYVRTNNTQKVFRIVAPNYTHATEAALLALGGNVGIPATSTSKLYFGGGSSALNCFSYIYFYTAADNTTTTGTVAMYIDDSQYVGIGTEAPVSNSVTLGTKSIQRDLVITRENTPAGTDSSIVATVDDGNGKIYLKAGDADSLALTCNNTNAVIKSNNPLLVDGAGGSVVTMTVDGNKTSGNPFQVINDNDGAVGDSTFVVSSTGAISSTNFAATNKLTACATNAGALDFSASSKTLTVADNVTVGLDINALEGLGSTGLVARTAANSYSERTVTGTANEITVSNGDGVSGNPTLSLPDAVTLGTNGGTSGGLDFVASDNDQGDVDISTDDELEFSNFSGGYQFDQQIFGNIEHDKISVALDDAHAMASDTLWFFENDFEATMTLDSIFVRATTDDQDVNVVVSNRYGAGIAVVDAITASTDGTGEVYTQTETTLTTSSITAGQVIGMTKPTVTSDNILISIYYHVTKAKR